MLCGPGRAKLAMIALLASIVMPAGAMASGLSMQVGRVTSQPIGHYEFCKKFTSECEPVKGSGAAPKVTDYGWDVIREINRAVNFSVTPKTDLEIFGKEEVWAYPNVSGDCEDYVLLKRHMLMEKGFSPKDLLITVVLQPNGDGHAVLTVRTDYGDYILDNMRGDVRLWSETGYTFVKRQSSEHAARWTKLGPGSATAVGTIKN